MLSYVNSDHVRRSGKRQQAAPQLSKSLGTFYKCKMVMGKIRSGDGAGQNWDKLSLGPIYCIMGKIVVHNKKCEMDRGLNGEYYG